MRALIQRVEHANVEIGGIIKSSIGKGLLVLLGIEDADTEEDIEWLCGKIARLRIFDDENGVMNIPVTDIGGSILVISQFTLHASTKKGNRPSYIKAARPEIAIPIYERVLLQLQHETGKSVQSGEFGSYMKILLLNDGPVTIFIDTKNRE